MTPSRIIPIASTRGCVIIAESDFRSAIMTFELASVETQLALLDWRNTQLSSITAQFEAAWPDMQTAIERHVAEMPMWKVAHAHVDPRPLARALITPWAEEQNRIAAIRAEDGLAEIVAAAPRDGIAGHAMTALPALAGAGLIAASIIAVPAVVSYATMVSVSIATLSFTALSTPLLLAGGVVLAGVSLTGGKVMGHAAQKSRTHLADRLKRHSRTVIFGDGIAPTARCLLNDTQAAVLLAGKTSLESADAAV